MMATHKPIVWAGIGLILATGLIHLSNAPDSFAEATYKGLLFVANGVGAAVAAFGIYREARTWGWGLALLVAGGALVAYALSRTVGLPGLQAEPDAWFEPLGVAAMVAEGLFVGLAAAVLAGGAASHSTGTRSPLLEQRLLD